MDVGERQNEIRSARARLLDSVGAVGLILQRQEWELRGKLRSGTVWMCLEGKLWAEHDQFEELAGEGGGDGGTAMGLFDEEGLGGVGVREAKRREMDEGGGVEVAEGLAEDK